MDANPGRDGVRIEVTPMADVVIVLLLIFMVMTPAIAERGIRLPEARHGQTPLPLPALLLRGDGALALDEGPPLPRSLLLDELRRRLERVPAGDRSVALRADREAGYDSVRGALALCREAGAERVALATHPASGGRP
jgi:biopolymer transport protein ExbD